MAFSKNRKSKIQNLTNKVFVQLIVTAKNWVMTNQLRLLQKKKKTPHYFYAMQTVLIVENRWKHTNFFDKHKIPLKPRPDKDITDKGKL